MNICHGALRFVVVLLLALCGRAAAKEAYGSAEPFRAGDTVCFVGDSITHGGSYHSIVTLFYATRFPERAVQYYNCGVGGDRAAGIMADEKFRLPVDILGRKPTVATVMLGMNDVGIRSYGPDKTGPDHEKVRQAALDTYNANMVKLLTLLQQHGIRVILITPSIYDDTVQVLPSASAKPAYVGANAGLGKCAEKVRQWAEQYHTGLVDFYAAMNTVNRREQKQNPAFSIVGSERVHPGAVGHFVMAYVFLKAQGMPRDVARLGVDAAAAKPGEEVNCRIDAVRAAPQGVEFDCLESSLPLVAPDDAKAALALVSFTEEMNQEILTVTDLASGTYELRIDGASAGEYSAAQLKAGVNLAENTRTPQYQQSARATQINTDRFRAGLDLRTVAAQNYVLSRAGVNLTDRPAVVEYVQARIDALAKAGQPSDSRLQAYLKLSADVDQLERRYAELSAALAEACRPQKHHFVISRKPGL